MNPKTIVLFYPGTRVLFSWRYPDTVVGEPEHSRGRETPLSGKLQNNYEYVSKTQIGLKIIDFKKTQSINNIVM